MSSASIISATGRRKTSIARVNLKNGSGAVTVNGKKIDDYFATATQRQSALQPLVATENNKKFDVQIRAEGGGLMGQAGAASLAIARALLQIDPEYRTVFRSKGLLTRDPRMKERKKPGQPGARRRFQFSKR
jgi:small subunit ribosomal protein S9